ncbi:MAG TPA: formylglycine-generating enzyme family protein [Verrucomicrobiae bacterium]
MTVRAHRGRLSSVLAVVLWVAASLTAQAQRDAAATATVLYGFVVSVTVTDGGSDYVEPPTVAFSGGGGSGATAVASVTNGAVSRIQVVSAGSGYTNAPTVVISRTPGTLLNLQLIPMLTITGMPGDTNQIQFANSLANGGVWTALANVVLTTGSLEWYDRISPPGTRGFYRTVRVGVGSLPTPGPQFVWLPPDHFIMGSPADEPGRSIDEGPQTAVTLTRGFFIGRYEVTQSEYFALIGSNPSHLQYGANPVEDLTWDQATNYCWKLTQQERVAGRISAGWAYRLPTEAEWEYACRAGTTNRFHYGDDFSATQLGNYAWYYDNDAVRPYPGGAKLANDWGLYDMMGNVLEWVQDWYATSYPGGSVTDPQGPASGSFHGARGGGYESRAYQCRSASRYAYCDHCWDVGFRLVLAPVR